MKPHSLVLALIAPSLLASTLAGCGTARQPGSSSGASGAAGYTASGSQQMGAGMTGDQDAMCELNRRLQATRAPDARQAMIKQYLPNMTPEMREMRLKAMRERCE